MRVQSLSCIALHTWVVLESLFAGICIRNYSGLLSLAPPADFAGEWQWEACQGTRKKRARVPARGTPTIQRAGLPSRRLVGTGLAPVLAVQLAKGPCRPLGNPC